MIVRGLLSIMFTLYDKREREREMTKNNDDRNQKMKQMKKRLAWMDSNK
jgi:hypothetical protein